VIEARGVKVKYSHIIWDWNGTLFNDVDWCFRVINSMLSKKGIKTLRGLDDYREAFCFPIIQYYRNVGFDFDVEPFPVLAEEFMSLYHAEKSGNCQLYPNAEATLEAIKKSGITQIILSASEKKILLSQINEFDITKYFDDILGISDIYAKSKIDIGLEYLSQNIIKKAVLIGDSVHDSEVADALGVDCILIPNGHQKREALQSCNVPMVDDISSVSSYLAAKQGAFD